MVNTPITATVSGGRLNIDVPADWPEGTEVEISLRQMPRIGESEIVSSEEIARTLAVMDACEAIEWSDAERAAWDASRNSQRDREKATFFERAELLRSQWE